MRWFMQRAFSSRAAVVSGALLLAIALNLGCPGQKDSQSEQSRGSDNRSAQANQPPALTPAQPTAPGASNAPPAAPAAETAPGPPASTTPAAAKPKQDFVEAAEADLPSLGAVFAAALNLRGGAGTTHPILRMMRCGEVVRVTDRDGHWYKVETFDKKGWASASFINLLDPKRGRIPACRYDSTKFVQVKPSPPPKAPTASPSPPPPPAELPKEQAKAQQIDPPPQPKVLPTPPPKNNEKGPAIIHLSTAGRAEPVRFAHHAHNVQFNCVRCHHGFTDEGNRNMVQGPGNDLKNCHNCHKKDSTSPVSSQKSFHKNCIPCHESKGLPTACSDCHNRVNAR